MTGKIFRNAMAVSIAVILVCMVCVTVFLNRYFRNVIADELREEANIIMQGVGDDDDMLSMLSQLQTENRITLISQDGTVVYDSVADESSMENHSDREEFEGAVTNGEATAARFSDTMQEQIIYYAVLLDDGSVLRLSNEQSLVSLLLRGLIVPFVIIMILAFFVAQALSSRAAKRIVSPINALNPSDENAEEPYPEIAPLLEKIRSQGRHINEQLTEIRRQQLEFMAITENMSEGFLLIDTKQEILSYNSAVTEVLGDGVSQIPNSAIELDRSPEFRGVVEESLAGNHSERTISVNNRTYSLIANPVKEHDAVVGAVILLLDVTEKESRDQLRREFTSNVSHELKTPLTTIYGVSDMMAAGIVKPEDVTGFAKNIKDESGRMIELIDDIIKLSRLDEGTDADEVKDVDINEMAATVIERLALKAEQKNVNVYLEGNPCTVSTNPVLLNEVIYNLCENAIKYSRDSGSVIISTELDEESNQAVIRVSDTGIGIPHEYRDRIFERFFRVEKSHSDATVEGTGLGLSIVKHAVAGMNGTINLESEEGVGTDITVSIPI